jgi:hypothetical protein
MKAIPDQTRVVITYTNLHDPLTPRVSVLGIDHYWSRKMSQYIRNDKTGLWESTDLADVVARRPPVPRIANFVQLKSVPPAIANIAKCIVEVERSVPHNLNGSGYRPRPSVGVVIDGEKGVVFVSRATIPHSLCDISITIADSIIIEGELLFSYPLHRYALIKYDPRLIIALLQSVKLSPKIVEQGTSLHFVGFKDNDIGGLMYTLTAVTNVCNL